jgi:DNA-binding transcriptional MerR regulator
VTATDLDTPAAPACTGPDDIAAELIAARTAAEGLEDGEACLPIAEVAELTGVTAHTLRYYERIGLVDVPRDAAGRRVYSRHEVARIVFVTRLRMTAMPIREIQAYFGLVAQGQGTEAERLDLLQRHRRDVVARMDELRSALSVIDFKIALYGGTPG